MRFPWLQVDADFIAARSRDFASLLPPVPLPEAGPTATRPVSRHEAMGMMLDLWSWVLGRVGPDAAPTGLVSGVNAPRLIAGAVEWRGDPGLLVEALVGSGLAEWDQSGVRLKGLDRYQRTWAKNSRRTTATDPNTPETGSTGRKPAENRQTAALERAETGALDADRDADGSSASQEPADAVPERPPLVLTEQQAGKKAKKPSAQQDLFRRLQDSRRERCDEVGEPWVEEKWSADKQNAKLKAEVERDAAGQDQFSAAWFLYLADDGQRVREPAWSLSYFMSDGVRTRYETKAAREAV